MVGWRILYLRQQIIPLLKESTMGKMFSQLTEVERNQISALLQEDVSQCRIAKILAGKRWRQDKPRKDLPTHLAGQEAWWRSVPKIADRQGTEALETLL